MDDGIDVHIYPPNHDDGHCILVILKEEDIPILVECLAEGYSVVYRTEKRLSEEMMLRL